MILRLFPENTEEEAAMIACAAKVCGIPLTISFDLKDERSDLLASLGCVLRKESLDDFLKAMPKYERVRTCSPNIPRNLYERAAETNQYIATARPVKEGRIELIHYIKEQSISFEYHRYGSISDVPPCE